MSADFKAFRKANNLTQKELATILQCTQGFISQIERGITPIPQDVISKILACKKWDTSSLVAISCSTAPVIDEVERATLISAIQEHGAQLMQHGEELRKQGERLDRMLDLVSQRERGGVPLVSQSKTQNSPPPCYLAENQIFVIGLGKKAYALFTINNKYDS